MTDYRTVNRANWDDRAQAHAASADYSVASFLSEPTHLSEVVRFDLPRLGDIAGLRVLHLQCHIGTDTLSLARLGATVTGLDFSPRSLEQARSLAEQAGPPVRYVESDVYHAVEALDGAAFDLVYTGIGALCWLPDVNRWAQTVAALLRPGGRLFIREGHPLLWALDEREDDLLVLRYPYFEQVEPLVWNQGGTYVETDVEFAHNVTHEWNHGLGEIVTAVLEAGMTVTGLVEHQSVPWQALPGTTMTQVELGEWQVRDRPERLPHSYTLQAVRNAV